ncbi:MAG: hypothetical protein JWM68_3143 [Verrucomicrobiales bacterium]|nr:hypothetical protein [Verrucomicrobiales bacterium]
MATFISAHAQILQNGSFESGFDGWTSNAGPGVGLADAATWAPSQGTNLVEIGGGDLSGSQLSQTFPVTGGSRYLLTFDQSVIGDEGLVGVLRVTVSTASSGTLATKTFGVPTHTLNYGQYVSNLMAFTVPLGETNATITFFDESADGGTAVDPLLDNVVIVESASAVGLAIYKSHEQILSVGGHTNRVRQTSSYLVLDAATGKMTAVTFGSTPETKWFQVLPLSNYKTFSVTAGNGSTNLIFSRAISGTNASGPVTIARHIKGTNARLTLNSGEVAALPRSFTGNFQDDFINGQSGEATSTSVSVNAAFAPAETAISRAAAENFDSAISRLATRLEALGYTFLPGQLAGSW